MSVKTPVLEIKRLILRPPELSDADVIFRNWTSDDDVTRYVSWSKHQSVDDTKQWLEMEVGRIDSDASYQWVFVHKETGELIGSGGFALNEERGMHELGYVLMKKYWNQGLATEAARAMVDFALGTLGIKALFARHARENPASGRVMEKVGFTYHCDGTCRCLDGVRAFHSKEYILTAP